MIPHPAHADDEHRGHALDAVADTLDLTLPAEGASPERIETARD